MSLLTPQPASKGQLLQLADNSLKAMESANSNAAEFVIRLIREFGKFGCINCQLSSQIKETLLIRLRVTEGHKIAKTKHPVK